MTSNNRQIDFSKTYLKARTLANLLGISKSKAYLLLQQGEIPVIRLGRSIRVHPDDLQEYLIRNQINTSMQQQQ
jgi:excisionase family DNA binding protein